MIAQAMNKPTSESTMSAAAAATALKDTGGYDASDSKHSLSLESDAESSDSGEQTLQTSEFSGSERCDSTFHTNSLPLRRRARRRRLNTDASDESDQWSLSESLPSSSQHHQQQQQQQQSQAMPQLPVACVECSVILLEDVDAKSISLQTALETWIRELRCYTELENPNILISKTLASCR